MYLHRRMLAFCLGFSLVAAAPAPAQESSQPEIPVTVTLGGRVHMDFSFPLETRPLDGRFGELDSDQEFRRARLHVTGRLYERVDYKVEIDFAGGDVTAKDIYIGLRDLSVGARFGHFKEPFSLEEQTSSRYITFIERSLVNSLVPSRNAGLMISDRFDAGRGTWAVGAFRDSDGFEATPGDNYGFTGRFTYAPVLEEGSRRLLHLGAGITRREIEGELAVSARPGDHLAPKLLSLALPAGGATTLNLEASANIGSLGVQAEYLSSSVDAAAAGDPRFDGFYVQASYFLTGETRPYSAGAFGRVRPHENFPDGSGALEIGGRYSRLDLSEGRPTLSELWTLTLGVNWYWNPHLRWMLNLERGDLDDATGDDYSSAHVRLAFDF